MVKRGLTGCDRILKIFKPRVQAYRNMGTPVIGPFCVSNRTASSGAAMKPLRAVLVEHDWDGVGLLAMTIYEQHRANMNFPKNRPGPTNMPVMYSSLQSIRRVDSRLTSSSRRR